MIERLLHALRTRDAESAAHELVRSVGIRPDDPPRSGEARARVRERTASCARTGVALPFGDELRSAIEAVLAADRALQQSIPGSLQERLARTVYGSAIEDLAEAADQA